MNLFSYFFFYFFIFYSIIGFGFVFSKFLNKNENLNLGYLGIYGIFFLALYSYLSHHFFAHTQIHNFFFITSGFLFYVYFFISSYEKKINHFFLFIVLCLIFISSLLIKNHDDFPYYHFAYTYYLTEYSSLFGVGVFNHGFRTPSSVFYINSLFYLPIIKFYTFHFVAVFVLVISNYILVKKIIDFYKENRFDFVFYLSFLSFAFINIVFYRIGEHGTDRSAQILVLVLIVELLDLINNKIHEKKEFSKFFILLGLIISFKAFFILYAIFILYFLVFLSRYVKVQYLLFKNLHLYSSILLVILSLFATFQNSGCFLYPIKFSCIGDFPWAIDKKEVAIMSNWYELWSKAGAGPNFRVANPDLYIQDFNWVANWIKVYAYPKITNTILGILAICIIFCITFFTKSKNVKIIRSYKVVLFFIFLLLIEWFIKHPALRYGGFCLVALVFFIPFSLLLESYLTKQMLKKISFLFILIIIIFNGRNIHRINNEFKQYNYKPLYDPTYKVEKSFFEISTSMSQLIFEFNKCSKLKNNCTSETKPKVMLFLNKYAFLK